MMRLRRTGHLADRLHAIHVRNENTPQSKAIGTNVLQSAVRTASGADVRLDTIERFDINTVTGIVNTIQERDISHIVVGMHRKTTVIDSFMGQKLDQLLRSTNCMTVISRCFIPLNTITRIVVFVPAKAQYETGFTSWVLATGNLAAQVGCRIIFCCRSEQQAIIRAVIHRAALGIRHEYRNVTDDDDFMLLANRVLDDDLMIVVSARPNSVSYSSHVTETQLLLQKIFPAQQPLPHLSGTVRTERAAVLVHRPARRRHCHHPVAAVAQTPRCVPPSERDEKTCDPPSPEINIAYMCEVIFLYIVPPFAIVTPFIIKP